MKNIVILFSMLPFSVAGQAAEGLLDTGEVYARVEADVVKQPEPAMLQAGHAPMMLAEGTAAGVFRLQAGDWLFAFQAESFVLNKAENYAWLKGGKLQLPPPARSRNDDPVLRAEIRRLGLDPSRFGKAEVSCRQGRTEGVWGQPRMLAFCDGGSEVAISCAGDDLVVDYKPASPLCNAS